MLSQKMIDARDFYSFPSQKWERLLAMKNKVYPKLKQGEFIHNDQIIIALRRMAQEQDKPVTITEAKPEGRGMRLFGKTLLIVAGIYFGIHTLVWLVK